MTLLAPAALWWLVLVLPILALFLLRPRPALVDVPSLRFWEDALDANRHGHLGRTLRRWLILSLHLLVIFGLTLALTQPSLPHGPGSLLFVLDDSATMQTVEPSGRTRLDLARSQILQTIEQLPPDVAVTIVLAGAPPTVAVRHELDRIAVRRSLTTVHSRDVNRRLTQAIALARRLDDSGAGRLVILSDRPPADVGLRATDRWLTVGTPQPNAGLTGLSIGPDKASLDVQINQDGSSASLADVIVVVDDRAVAHGSVALRGAAATLNIPVNLTPATPFRVELSTADSLALDNTLFGVWPSRSSLHPLIVTDRSIFLPAALEAADETIRAPAFNNWDFSGFDVVFLDGVSDGPGHAVPGQFVIFGDRDPFRVVAGGTPSTDQEFSVTQWKPGSLILKGVDVLPWRIRKIGGLRPPRDAEVIALSGETPLIFVVRRTLRSSSGMDELFHAIYVNFQLLDSNLPELFGIATLIPNMLDHFEGAAAPTNDLFQLTGAPLTFAAPRERAWEVSGPSHESLSAYLQGPSLIVPITTHAGFHRASSAAGRVTQAVNYLAEHSAPPSADAAVANGVVSSSFWWSAPPWMITSLIVGVLAFVELLLTGSGLISTE